MGYILNESNKMPANMSDKLKFTLTEKGLKIGKDDI